MDWIKKNSLTLCLLLFLSVFYFTNDFVKDARKTLHANYALDVSSMPPVAMKLMTGEFSGLIADYILLQIGAFIGSDIKIKPSQWDIVLRGFQQVLSLDPRSQTAYLQAQGILAWEGNMPKETIELLKISAKHRTTDWMPGYYMGFDYYYFLKNFEKASKVYLETSKIENAPIILALLGSRFAIKEQRIQTSISALENMLQDQVLDDNSKNEINMRIQILKAIEYINKAILVYKSYYYLSPESLDDLVTYHIIEKLPKNPYNMEYQYDPDTGEILFD